MSDWMRIVRSPLASLYSSSEENEASRRMKTEFLVQLDGAGTKAKDIILVVGKLVSQFALVRNSSSFIVLSGHHQERPIARKS